MPARVNIFRAICFLLPVLGCCANHAKHLRMVSVAQKAEPEPALAPPKLKYDATPKSPKHRRDITPGDPHEGIDYAAEKAADEYLHVFGSVPEGSPGDFYGGTCKEVCAACLIAADPDYPSCRCRATCEQGPDATQCPKKLNGWLGKRVTTPDSRWKAVCNAGKSDCDSCVDAEAKKEIDECRKDKIPAICFNNLKNKYGTSEAATRYCTRGELSGCETFNHSPTEDGWKCFDDLNKCIYSKTGPGEDAIQAEAMKDALAIDDKIMPLATPCVWCGIPVKK